MADHCRDCGGETPAPCACCVCTSRRRFAEVRTLSPFARRLAARKAPATDLTPAPRMGGYAS